MAVARPYEGFSGKFRRRPIRRTAGTPYDRPASANQSVRIQSATADKKKGWLSKLVDPLRIIASSASRIFSFQTCLTAPPEAAGMVVPCTDENHHSCKGFSEVACTIPEKEFASPAELAKEYMGSKLSKAPSSALSLRNQLFRKDALPSIIPYGRQISQISTAPKFVTHFSGISEPHRNGYMTPISIGRSSRSPFCWAPSATNIKVHKRGSSVLDNDLGCPGPIRRLRQKYNLRSPSKDIHWSHENRLPDPSTTLNSNGTESLKIPVEKPLAPLDYTSDLNEDNKVANGKEKIGSSATDFAKSGSVAVSSGRRPDPSTTLNSNCTKMFKIPVEKALAPQYCTSDLNEDNKVANGKEKIGSSATDFAKSGSVEVSSGRRPTFQMRAPEVRKRGSKRGSSVLDNDLGCPVPIRRVRQKYNLRSPSTALNSNGAESLKIPVEKPLAPQDYTSDLNEDNKAANGKEKIDSSATDFSKSCSIAVSSGRRPGFQMRAPEFDFDLDDDDYNTNEASNRFPTGNVKLEEKMSECKLVTKLNTEEVEMEATKGDVEFSFPVLVEKWPSSNWFGPG